MDERRPILLVEDNPMDVELALRALTRHKVVNPVEVARDGEEVLARMASWDAGAPLPVLVLLDTGLPKISGLEVLRRLKGHTKYRVIPVVMLTSSNRPSDLQDAYEAGVNSYLVKPVDFKTFVEMIGSLHSYWCNINTLPKEAKD